MGNKVLIFGREPAAYVGVIEAALALAIAFWAPLSHHQVGLIMACVTAAFGLYTAIATRDSLLATAVGLAKALIALGVGFGLSLTDVQTGAIIAFVTIVLGLFNRQVTEPVVRQHRDARGRFTSV